MPRSVTGSTVDWFAVLLAAFAHLLLVSVAAAKPRLPKTTGHWGEDAVGFRWEEADSRDERPNQMDTGPFFSASLDPPGGVVAKALAIRAGADGEASVCFDTEMLSVRAVWSGGFIEFDPARFGLIQMPRIAGRVDFHTRAGPGWPGASGRYRGLHLGGERVVLEYEIAGTKVLESFWTVKSAEVTAVSRTLRVGEMPRPLTATVWDAEEPIESDDRFGIALLRTRSTKDQVGDEAGTSQRAVAISGGAAELSRGEDSRVTVRFPESTAPRQMTILYFHGTGEQLSKFADLAENHPGEKNLEELARPGAARWGEPLKAAGRIGAESRGAFAVDTLGVPFANPHKALMFLSGHDFFSDGRAAVCTVHGDVWIVDGISQSLRQLTWKRFATGLYQPLGLRIVDDQLYVLGRDQITRPADRNGDGEADHYENFYNGVPTLSGGHDYSTCLETDAAGNFFFLHAGLGLVRISPDGASHEILADGLRNPNGMSVAADGTVTVAPQEGEWVPASAVIQIRQGGYYGFGGPKRSAERPLGYDPPICWIPRLEDNSGGGQVWVPPSHWGQLEGQLLGLSYGRCSLYLILRDTTDGIVQGGIVRLPVDFASGAMRGRFHPLDGHLYVTGLRGWVTSAAQDGCFQRVRWTGKPIPQPTALKIYGNGLLLTFGVELERTSAEDPGSFAAEQWNYRYGAEYGSADYRTADPTQQGHDAVDIRTTTLLDDGRSVFLEMPSLAPVMQMRIRWSLFAADSSLLEDSLSLSIHQLPERRMSTRPTGREPALDARQQQLEPGLIQRFRQPAGSETSRADARTARLAAYYCAADQPPTPFLLPVNSAGPVETTWEGFIQLPINGRYRFRLVGRGQAVLLVNEREVFRGPAGSIADTPSGDVVLRKGLNALRLDFKSPTVGPAELRLYWESSSFGPEPVPPEHFMHDAGDAEWMRGRLLRRGREQFAMLGCIRCHDLRSSPEKSQSAMPETQRDFPSLAGVGSRLKPAWIYRWLLHPRGEWSAASMPALLGDPSDPVARKRAADLTAYLIGLRTTQRDSAVPPVAASAASERSVESSPRSVSQTDANAKPAQPRDPHSAELGERLYEQLGCIACHTLRGDASGTSAAGDERIPLEHVTRKFQPAALSRYLAAPHTDHAWSAMPDFQLDRREAESLADYLFQAVPMDGEENDGHVAGDSAVGRDLFLSLGCAACHTDGEMDHSNRLTESGTPVRTGIDARGIDRGCLAPRENENRRGPCYELAETDRRALGMFITTGGTSLEHRSEYEFAERSFVRLRCGACHARDGVADRRSKLVLEEGVTGQPPEPIPSLTWAGEKLRGTWTHRLLAGELDYPARPWLAARMPVFPVVAEALAHGLALEHGLPPVDDQESFPVSAELAEQGRRLTLKDGGLDCRLCHAARDEVLPLENRSWGIGLANISDRLRREFYLHWMLDPLRIDPATKMPKFSADRQWTEARDILDGEALPQFEAIWHYLHSPAVRRTHESEELLGR